MCKYKCDAYGFGMKKVSKTRTKKQRVLTLRPIDRHSGSGYLPTRRRLHTNTRTAAAHISSAAPDRILPASPKHAGRRRWRHERAGGWRLDARAPARVPLTPTWPCCIPHAAPARARAYSQRHHRRLPP